MLRSIVGLLLLAGAVGAQTFTSPPGSPIRVGIDPVAVVVADFNGDGKPDLAIANYDENDITILLGNGSGGFSAAPGSPFVAGSSPIALTAADFNRDGKQDLAVANGDGSVTILLGNGTGGFTAAAGSPIATSLFQVSVATGDFNGDGNPDLVIADEVSNNVTVLLGDGRGGFTPASGSPFAAGTDPRFVVVADFNLDGKADLAVSNGDTAGVTILLGNGSGGFTSASGSPFTAGAGASAIAVGDFNKDGKPDLAVVNGGRDSLTVLLGDGLGGFAAVAGSTFAAGGMPTSAAVGDFNGDGNPDVAVTSQTGNTVTMLLGNGAGGFMMGRSFATGESPSSLAVGDFNADGRPDLAIANSFSDDVTILLGSAAVAPQWTITKTHSGNFTPGQNGAMYAIAVANVGGAASSGAVTVTDTVPTGLTLVMLSGTGWSCLGNSCSRSDVLAAGQSYPAITASVNVAVDAPAVVVNRAAVTGGGATAAGAADSTTIQPLSGIYFSSVPSGAVITVDGFAKTTPFTVGLSSGTHTVSAAVSFSGGAGVQYTFSTWNDSLNTATRTITVGSQPASYTATYSTQYQLTVGGVPGHGGTVSPASGFYSAGTMVPVTATPNPGFLFGYWQGPVASATNASTSVTLSGPQTVTAYFTTDNTGFVTALYQDLLNRAPDSAGLSYWLGQLNSGNYTRSSMAGQFFTSPEFSNNGLYVIKLYISILKRDPDFTGWKYWVDQLRAGTPPISVLNSFITAPEFTMLYGNASNQDLVTLLYRNVLGREPDSAGLAYWLGLINNGTYTRATLTDQFVRSPEFDRSVRARAYANLLYMGFLRRTADSTGLAYWMGVLADPTALPGAIGSFITSPEYLGRF